jgi:uncharacterized membrane protein YkvI
MYRMDIAAFFRHFITDFLRSTNHQTIIPFMKPKSLGIVLIFNLLPFFLTLSAFAKNAEGSAFSVKDYGLPAMVKL